MKTLFVALLLLFTVPAFAECPLSLSGGVEREWGRVQVSRHDSDLQGRWQGYVVGRAEIKPDLYLTGTVLKPFQEDSKLGYRVAAEYRFWCSRGSSEAQATDARRHDGSGGWHESRPAKKTAKKKPCK